MAVDAERAHAVMEAITGPMPPGHLIRVVLVGSGQLWSAACVDDRGMIYAGGTTLVGPDERVWTLSSNPGIHDYDLGVRLLEAAYNSGSVHALDPGMFADRLAEITQRRIDDEDTFLKDVRAGSLRGSTRRHLP